MKFDIKEIDSIKFMDLKTGKIKGEFKNVIGVDFGTLDNDKKDKVVTKEEK